VGLVAVWGVVAAFEPLVAVAELLELLELELDELVLAGALLTLEAGTVKLGAPLVSVVPVLPLPQAAGSRPASTSATATDLRLLKRVLISSGDPGAQEPRGSIRRAQ
jgi:hypothetical protein